MVAINLCILAAVAVIVFCAILPTAETLFGGAKFPVATAVTLLGVLGLLKEYAQQRISLIDTILVPYQALFISIVAFFIVVHVIGLWKRTLSGDRKAGSRGTRFLGGKQSDECSTRSRCQDEREKR